MQRWFAEHAWLPDGPATAVTIEAVDGRITRVQPATAPASDARRLPGLVMPGFANAHSHAFHRALRGRTHADGGTFWTWRERMYAVADRLDPERYLALARAAYAELALAGWTLVGEFHYVHHRPGGRPYDDPHVMSAALVEAAAQAGVRLTLLDACYLRGGLDGTGHAPLGPHQLRFGDGSAGAWADRMRDRDGRVDRGRAADRVRLGAAIHSVRAVPADQLALVAEAAAGRPLHVHLSEQPAENLACLEHYGRTPVELLADAGALGPATTAVHATHLTDTDVDRLAATGTSACLCPTTERDLADGIGPARRLLDAGVPLCVGSDQHAVVDPLEELRALEGHERLASGQRGRFTPAQLVAAGTASGYRALGWPDGGALRVGAVADLVAIRLGSPRTAGALPAQALYAATASDVDTVVVGGETIVSAGEHRLGDVGRLLADAIADVVGGHARPAPAGWRP